MPARPREQCGCASCALSSRPSAGGATPMLTNRRDERCDDRSDDEDAEHHGRDLREDEQESPNAVHSSTLRTAARAHIGPENDLGLILQE